MRGSAKDTKTAIGHDDTFFPWCPVPPWNSLKGTWMCQRSFLQEYIYGMQYTTSHVIASFVPSSFTRIRAKKGRGNGFFLLFFCSVLRRVTAAPFIFPALFLKLKFLIMPVLVVVVRSVPAVRRAYDTWVTVSDSLTLRKCFLDPPPHTLRGCVLLVKLFHHEHEVTVVLPPRHDFSESNRKQMGECGS